MGLFDSLLVSVKGGQQLSKELGADIMASLTEKLGMSQGNAGDLMGMLSGLLQKR